MLIFDIESWPNVFIVTFKKYKKDESFTFVVSNYRDDRPSFYAFVDDLENVELFGFNSWHYDSPLLQYCLEEESLRTCSAEIFCLKVKNKSDEIIMNDEPLKKTWKWIDIDGYKYWSKMIRKSKRISLKSLGIQLNYEYVMELPFKHYQYLSKQEIDKAIEYNAIHDISITELLATSLDNEIQMRKEANKKYNFNSLSWDGVKLGFNILMKLYSEKTGTPIQELMNIEPKYPERLPIQQVLLPQITYKKVEGNVQHKKINGKDVCVVKSPYVMLRHMRHMMIDDFRFRLLYKNIAIDVGKGGLHSVDDRKIITPNIGERLIDVDFSSYYPFIVWKHNKYSRNFPEMPLLAGELIQERVACKKSDPSKANLLKLALNGGLVGTMNDSYRPTYDPRGFFSVTINGQMILLKLIETLSDISQIVSVNTDGVTVRIMEKDILRLKLLINSFQEEWKMPIEFDYYDKIIRENVNNYLAIRSDDSPEISKGKTKKKGVFQTSPVLGDSCNFLIIPKAVEQYYLNDIDIEEYVTNHKNVYDFCGSAKVDSSYQVMWGEKVLPQRLNRYYPSKSGQSLYKFRDGKKVKMPGVPAVKLLNHPDKNIDIDYGWFIREIKNKLIFSNTLF